MTATKTTIIYAMEVQQETSYLNPVTFAPATDGVLLAERTILNEDYMSDGARGSSAGSAGSRPNAGPSGLFGEVDVKVEMRGNDVVYAAGVGPSELDVLLLASGFKDTFNTPDQDYNPISSAFESCAVRLFGEGQQHDLTGVYADWRYDIEGPGFGVFTFSLKGKAAIPIDASVPGTLAYLPATLIPPKAESLALTLNAFAAFKVRKLALIGGRAVGQRPDLNDSKAFAGYAAGRRDTMMEVTVEAEALASFNPYTLRDAGTQMVASFSHGSVALNGMDFLASQAQIINVEVEDDDPVALWNLTLKLPTSGATANDDLKLTFTG